MLLLLFPASTVKGKRRYELVCPDACTGYVRHVTHDEIADAVG
jgi:hypothetical protein